MATHFNVLMCSVSPITVLFQDMQSYFHISMFTCAVSCAVFFLQKLVKKDFKDRIVHCRFQICSSKYSLPVQSIRLLISQQTNSVFL